MALKGKKYVWICIAPAMILIMAFLIYPLIQTVIYSFSSWYNFALTSEWIGLDNYKPVSYTHLDVYKRQVFASGSFMIVI